MLYRNLFSNDIRYVQNTNRSKRLNLGHKRPLSSRKLSSFNALVVTAFSTRILATFTTPTILSPSKKPSFNINIDNALEPNTGLSPL
ncbi:hypothetical protein FOMA001_g5524 [Fusarium oxysporum f. sp. matthiolae]|nr:hypothetical protein FOMA001_g5524 [Fusarium oxysporum f. sp. matthiolae]